MYLIVSKIHLSLISSLIKPNLLLEFPQITKKRKKKLFRASESMLRVKNKLHEKVESTQFSNQLNCYPLFSATIRKKIYNNEINGQQPAYANLACFRFYGSYFFTRHNYTGGFRFCMEQRVDFQRIDWIKLQYNVTWCCDRFS